MGSFKGGASATTGFRYYFAVLAGVCRGPVDEIFLIKTADNIMFDGKAYRPDLEVTKNDPEPPVGVPTDTSWAGPITETGITPLWEPNVYGGESSEGGVLGWLWTYMGDKTQLIPAADWIRSAMAGLTLPAMRGVLTVFFDGEVCANNPYPKAWRYRIRRALKGWDGDVWYPEKAMIELVDPAIPAYVRGVGDTNFTVTAITYSPGPIDSTGASTDSGTQTTVTSTYQGAQITTFDSATGTTVVNAVPAEYNIIRAMNGAHIVYECVTNRDWGRGMDPALIDHKSFAAAADILYDEGFGLCLKWSRTDDIDAFVQVVIDHIGGVVYTDRTSGLLSLRLIRSDYDESALSVFDYDSGLIEVTSVETAANDSNENEVIVKYNSPVLDAEKEARQHNLASINQLGCIYSVTKNYPGLPTSTLAVRVAARDLQVSSFAWKKITFKVDRRGYRITPGDVFKINSPDRGLNNVVIRVATIEDSVMTDGTITIVASQDAYSLPTQGLSEVQPSQWLPTDITPKATTDVLTFEASYYDFIRAGNMNGALANSSAYLDYADDKHLGFQVLLATKPSSPAMNFKIMSSKHLGFSTTVLDPVFGGIGTYASFATLSLPCLTTDETLTISGGLDPRVIDLPQMMLLVGDGTLDGRLLLQEFVYVTAITRDPTTGVYTATCKRGCVDLPAVGHPIGAKLFNYAETGAVDTTEYNYNDIAETACVTHTSRGDFPYTNFGDLPRTFHNFGSRLGNEYIGADFRVNGFPRDQMPSHIDMFGTIFTRWKHRNKVTQADQVFSETDSDVIPPPNLLYTVDFRSLATIHHHAVTTSDNNVILDAADLVAAGLGNEVVQVVFTARDNSLPLHVEDCYGSAYTSFYFGTPGGTGGTGFNYDFDNNFGS